MSVKIEKADDASSGASGPEVRLTISDDGAGFDQETAELGRGYGLPNIKDRAERLGGVLNIQTAPGEGVKLEIKFPAPGQKR